MAVVATALAAAACKDATPPNNSVSSIVVSPKSSRLYNIGDLVAFSAIVATNDGTSPDAVPVSWTARDTTLLQVSTTGNAVVRKRGGSTWVVATAGTKSDSGFVDVPSSACGSTAVTSVAAGQVVTDLTTSSVCVLGVAGDFAVLVHNNSLLSAGVASYEATAIGVDTPPVSVRRSPLLGAELALAGSKRRVPLRRNIAVDEAMRRSEAAFTPAMVAASRAAFLRGSRRASFAVAPPTIGSTIKVNVNTLSDCTISAGDTVRARVAAVSNRAIVVTDPRNPTADAYTDDELASIAARFDTLIHPLDSATFGAPTDIDNNGRSILVFTQTVNQRTPNGADYYIGGLTTSRDFRPVTGTNACAGSNAGEYFYLLVPDSLGVVNGNTTFPKSFVNDVIDATIVHEYQHMINFGRRTFVQTPAAPAEEVWLNEGLSHMAEELLYHQVSGVPTRANIGRAAVLSNPQVWEEYLFGNFSLYDSFASLTTAASPFRMNDNLETRGATWAFLRYAADRKASTDGTLWYSLVNSQLSGVVNLESALGVNAAGLLGELRDFTISAYTDDWVMGVPSRYTQPSLNMRDMYKAFKDPNYHYPLEAGGIALSDGQVQSIALQTGGFQLLRFRGRAGTNTFIHITGSGGAALPTNTIITVIRLN